MIRKILIAVVLFFLFLGVAFTVLIQTVDVNQYLPQILAQVSNSLGRDFRIAKVRLHWSIKQGVMIDVSEVSLAEDSEFSKDAFVKVKNIHCGVAIIPLITQRKIEIISIEIQSPVITLIRNAQGQFNFDSLLKSKKSEPSSSSGSGGSASQVVSSSLPELLVNNFSIINATVEFKDRSANPAMALTVDQINAKVEGFSFQEPFKIFVQAALMAPEQNFQLQGTSRMDLKLQQVRLDDIHLSFNLAPVDLKRLINEIPALASLQMVDPLKGEMTAVINQMLIGAKGLLVLSMDGEIKGAAFKSQKIPSLIDQINAKMDVTESKLKISQVALKINSATIQGEAAIKDYLGQQEFAADIVIDRVRLEDVVDQSKAPVAVKGVFSGNGKFSGRGFSVESVNALKGKFQGQLSDGQITNINVLANILNKVPGGALVNQLLGDALTQSIGKDIAGDSTQIKSAGIKARIEQSKIYFDELSMESPQFTLLAEGTLGFNQSVALRAELRLSKEATQNLIESASDMKALMDQDQQIHFPVSISGTLPQLSYIPDAAYISRLLLINKGSSQLEKVLDKNPEAKQFLEILTGKGASSSESENAPSNNPPTENSSGETKSLIKDLLDQAF